MSNVQTQILSRLRHKGRGKVFTSKDFLDLGTRDAIDQTLSRLSRAGPIQRLGRGLYHYPRKNPRLGISLSPDTDEIARALARQTGSRVAPSGAVAANRLGLSTQVPAKPIYLTDGRTRQVRVGKLVFIMKHVPPKELPSGSLTSALVFQALRHVGREAVDEHMISRIRRNLSAKQRTELLRDARYTTDWIAGVIREIAGSAETEMDTWK
jgi:hypothetical protein